MTMAMKVGLAVLGYVVLSVAGSDLEAEAAFAAAGLLEGDECDAQSDSSCALNALQIRAVAGEQGLEEAAVVEETPHKKKHKKEAAHASSPAVRPKLEVTTWMELKDAVEGNPEGAIITVTDMSTLVFEGTINIKEGGDFEISSPGKGSILDGKNAWGRVRLFYVRGKLSLNNFLLKRGNSDYAGAVYMDFGSFVTITHCVIEDCTASYEGGAILANGAHLSLTDVVFKKNAAANHCKEGKHCKRKKHGKRHAKAVYVLSHSQLTVSLHAPTKGQDFYFDKGFDGKALFSCDLPSVGAKDKGTAKKHIKQLSKCEDSTDTESRMAPSEDTEDVLPRELDDDQITES